jgi:hypothetical protein
MKYVLFTYRDPTVELDADQRASIPAAVESWCTEMDDRGVRLQGHVLGSVGDTKTVRIRDGELLTSDGPAVETPVQIAGFSILECADLEEALEVASKNPGASFGILELRPFAD